MQRPLHMLPVPRFSLLSNGAGGCIMMMSQYPEKERFNMDILETVFAFTAGLALNTVLPLVILIGVGILVIYALMTLLDRALAKTKLEGAAASLIKSLLRVVLYLLLAMMVADRLGVDVTGVVALASVASLAISLALQDMLANVIGGFTLLSNHPFKSGDYVEIAGQSGVVQTIDITYTKLTTPDNKVISIPNSSVVASQIVNYSTAPNRRVDISISASYNTPSEKVREALLRAADVPTVVNDPDAPFVGLVKYGESAIEYTLRVWTPNADYWTTLFTINENIRTEFAAAGVEMTFPHLNVHLDK